MVIDPITNPNHKGQLKFKWYKHRGVTIMLKQEADEVIERIREDLKRHGVVIGFDPVLTQQGFGCDLDYLEPQVSEDPEKRVLCIVIHDEGLWTQLKQGSVHRCVVSECNGKIFGVPVIIEPQPDDSYTIQYRS